MSVIYDIRQFNIFGNNETSEFGPYWKSEIRAMDMESAHGEHERIHDAGDSDANNRISYSLFISTNHLIKITIHILENDILKQGVDL